MDLRRTDLALEAQELWRAAKKSEALQGAEVRTRQRGSYAVEEVEILDGALAEALGKPCGRYVTLDLRARRSGSEEDFLRAVELLRDELRRLLPAPSGPTLVVGLGNADMTPDAIGTESTRHILPTRHLRRLRPFTSLAEVSVLLPGVLGRTGLEAAEIVRGAVREAKPAQVIAIDALASARLERLCATVQLTDAGIVPGSGVGNARQALSRDVLGVPVIAVGVPTVVDALTLARDVFDAAGADPVGTEKYETVMVTPRDIDAQVQDMGRIVGFGVSLALAPQLRPEDLRALLA